MDYFKHSILLFTLVICLVCSCASEGVSLKTLKQVQVVFRHGDRTPVETYPTDPYQNFDLYWPEGKGQLTEKGKQQQYELGQFLRQRYDGFIDSEYKRNEIYVLSSDLDRTLMSAEANLAGLYPVPASKIGVNKLDIQPVPVHIVPTKEDKIIRLTAPCPRLTAVVNALINTSSEYAKLVKDNRDFLDYIQVQIGVDFSNLFLYTTVLDPLYCEHEHGLKLPAWVNSTVYDRIQDIAGSLLGFRNGGNMEIRRLRGGPLAEELVDNMKKIMAGSWDGHKLNMFSGHDFTLAALLTTLDVYNSRTPSYTTAFIVELHQNDTTGIYFVNLYYRNSTTAPPYELNIPGCGTPCYFDHMVQLLGPVLPQQWEQECLQGVVNTLSLAPDPDTSLNGNGLGYAATAAIAGLMAAAIVVWLSIFLATRLKARNATFSEVRPILRGP